MAMIRKRLSIIFAVIAATVAALMLAACDGGNAEYTIKFDSGDGGTFAGGMHTVEMTTVGGRIIELPTVMVTDGFEFLCFNTRADGTGDEITAETVFTADGTVYAVWDNVAKKRASALEKTVTAIGKMVDEGFDADCSGEYASSKTEKINFAFGLNYADGRVTATESDRRAALELATGELFVDSGDGFELIRTLYTADTVKAVKRAISALGTLDYKEIAKYVTYDEAAHTVTVDAAIAGEINEVLGIVQNAYARNYSVGELIDAFLARRVGASGTTYTVSSIIDALVDAVVLYKNDNLETFAKRVDGMLVDAIGLSTEQIIELLGAEEQFDEVKDRKVGQVAAGFVKFIGENFKAMPDSFDRQTIEALAAKLIDDLFYSDEEFTAKTEVELRVSAAAAKALINTYKVSALVAMLDETDRMQKLAKTVITSCVKLTKENVKLTAIYDETMENIISLALTFDVAHDYADPTDLPFLGDNEYNGNINLVFRGD